jgi:hypothetical protein
MTKYLPTGRIKWGDPSKHNLESIMKLAKNRKKGYWFNVDLEYVHKLHDSHNDYPLAPEKMIIGDDIISNWTRNGMNKHGMKLGKVAKLTQNLNDKKEYRIHYVALQQCIEMGLKLGKIHEVVEFDQSDWMAKYINLNTKFRTAAKFKFEKELYKLMSNAVFGKTMENVRDRIDFKLINNVDIFKKHTELPSFKSFTSFNENLVGLHRTKCEIKLNKPIYVGASILDLSKTLMYDFNYNFIKKIYGNKAELLGTDTDSLKYCIETEDLYMDMHKNSD